MKNENHSPHSTYSNHVSLLSNNQRVLGKLRSNNGSKHCKGPVLPLKAPYMGTILKWVGVLSPYSPFSFHWFLCSFLFILVLAVCESGRKGDVLFFFPRHGGPFVVLAIAAQSSQKILPIYHHPDSPGSCHDALI